MTLKQRGLEAGVAIGALGFGEYLTNGLVSKTAETISQAALNAINISMPIVGAAAPFAPFVAGAYGLYSGASKEGRSLPLKFWHSAEKGALLYGGTGWVLGSIGAISTPLAPAILAGGATMVGTRFLTKFIKNSVSEITGKIKGNFTSPSRPD